LPVKSRIKYFNESNDPAPPLDNSSSFAMLTDLETEQVDLARSAAEHKQDGLPPELLAN